MFSLRDISKLKVKFQLFWDMTTFGLLYNFGDLGGIAASM